MIYIHGKNGDVANEYSESSGVKYILEYDCRGRNVNAKIDTSAKRFIHVACSSKKCMDEWANRHEVLLNTVSEGGIRYFVPDWCVHIPDGDFSYFCRAPIKIDWSKDYHFYEDKGYETK